MEPHRHTDQDAAAEAVRAPADNAAQASARAAVWAAARGRMLAHAYRMLGSWQDAEDVVQEAWLRMATADDIRTPDSFLTTTVTRLAIDRLRQRQRRQEDYIGPWIAEPVASDLLPEDAAIDRDLLSLAAIQLLERLTPPERATYVLRTGFAYSFRDIGVVIDHTESACRQLYRRATARLGADARFDADPSTHGRLLEALLHAARDGALRELETLLAHEAVLWADGGGKVSSALKPIHGRAKIARFLVGVTRENDVIRVVDLNGLPTLEIHPDGLTRFISLRVRDGLIDELLVPGNPDKLGAT